MRAPVVLTGVPDNDHEAINRLLEQAIEADLYDLVLPKNFSGDVVLDVRLRYVGGALKTMDHSLQKRRRRLYGRDK